uniref:C2H2-type domain-containing protein n=1 Tax=Anopheles melas TaxID=34690 RepID=A0A182TV44_9DIPT
MCEKEPTVSDKPRHQPDAANGSDEPSHTVAQSGELTTSKTSKKKGYISVASLFAPVKTARKEQAPQQTPKQEPPVEESNDEVAAAVPVVVSETTESTSNDQQQLPTNVAEASASVLEDVAENKTEQSVSSPPPAVATAHDDTVEVNGLSNLPEATKVQPVVLPVEEPKESGREGSVASGDSGESSASSSSSTEEVVGVAIEVTKQSTAGPEGVGTLKESSPASDSGIESVNESSTPAASSSVPKRPRGRPKSTVSFAGASAKEDKPSQQLDQAKQQQQQQQPLVKEEKELKPRPARRKSIHNASLASEKEDGAEEEESAVVAAPGRAAGKRAVRTARKPSVKAKEAAESAEVEQQAAAEAVAVAVATSAGGEAGTKCSKCELCFKTELWYRKHLINIHGIEPEEVTRLLLAESSSESKGSSPAVPEAAAAPEPAILTNGGDETTKEVSTVGEAVETAAAVADESLQNGHSDEVAQATNLPPVAAVPSKLAQTSPTTGRKRKSTPYHEEEEPSIPTSTDALAGSNNSEPLPVKESVLPPAAKVKVEHRAQKATTEETESPSTELAPAQQLAKRRKSSITPIATEATKQEKPDPDDLDKLTPFESAKVTVLESEMTGETHYTCTICGGQFTGKATIKEHLGTVHAAIKRRSCEYCGRTFLQTGDLTRHVRIHTGQRPFKCPVVECSFAFISSGDLHKHVRRHNQQPMPKPHVCDQCGKDFERSYDLKRHKTMHAKSEPDFKGITCGVCGKVFARRDQFRAHTYRHIGYRPYQCEICGKSFTDPSNYSKHARLHEMDGVEVVCNFCNRPFKNKSAISKHIFHCQQKMAGASPNNKGEKRDGASKKGGSKEGGGKKSRRVGVAIGYGKDGGGGASGGGMTVKPKQEKAADESEQPSPVAMETAHGGAMNGGRTKQAKKKRKRRRMRTPSSTEEEDDVEGEEEEEEMEDEDDDSGDDFRPDTSELASLGVTVKRERRSRKSGGVVVGAATEA